MNYHLIVCLTNKLTMLQQEENLKPQPFVYRNIPIMYKDTEIRYCNDDSVDQDDLTLMCNILYQHELLAVFGLDEPDMKELTNRMDLLYEEVKMEMPIIDMIKTYYFQDEVTTFMSLFSYDTFHEVNKLICDCLMSSVVN